MRSTGVHQTGWIVPRLPRNAVADIAVLDHTVTEIGLVDRCCTSFVLDTEDTVVAITVEAAAFEQLLVRMWLGTAGLHPAFLDRCRIEVRDSRMRHSWAGLKVELLKFGSFQPYLSAVVAVRSGLRAGTTSVVLGS